MDFFIKKQILDYIFINNVKKIQFSHHNEMCELQFMPYFELL